MEDKTKAKIIDLVPDAMDFIDHCPNPDCGAGIPAAITLAVVLRATEKSWATMYAAGGGLIDGRPPREVLPEGLRLYQIIRKWNLEHDNYDAQSQGTKEFIGSLLGV